jgi:hypothetical protein
VLARAGTKLWTRTTLTGYRAPSVHSVVKVGLDVPQAAAHHTTMLTVTVGAGPDLGDLIVQSDASGVETDVLVDPSSGGPASLDELITELRTAQRQDEVTAQLRNVVSGRVYAEHSRRASTALEPVVTAAPASVF